MKNPQKNPQSYQTEKQKALRERIRKRCKEQLQKAQKMSRISREMKKRGEVYPKAPTDDWWLK